MCDNRDKTEVNREQLLSEIKDYYSGKISIHGTSPQGVDWKDEKSQFLRFEQLSRIIQGDRKFTLTDLGCGYGALYSYLASSYKKLIYHGYDISDDMIEAATSLHVGKNVNFVVSDKPEHKTDYAMASGIFNVRLNLSDTEWHDHLLSTLDMLNAVSLLGFSFNCLTSYSDKSMMKNYLYYADPCNIFDACKTRYSKDVALLHDYGLYEFTILVRKS